MSRPTSVRRHPQPVPGPVPSTDPAPAPANRAERRAAARGARPAPETAARTVRSGHGPRVHTKPVHARTDYAARRSG